MLGSSLVWGGLGAALAGLVSLLRPLTWLGIGSRRVGLGVLGVGLLAGLAGMLLPVPLHRSSDRRAIDASMPAYNFNEVHTTRVRATPERALAAIRSVTLDEIRLARTLMAIRSLGRRPSREPAARPVLDAATAGRFVWLARTDRELVVGTIGQFWRAQGASAKVPGPEEFLAFDQPGWAKAVMNFAVEDQGGGVSRITTETRIFATDPDTARLFAAYWRVIYPGSALLRRTWLDAVRQKAEAGPGGPAGPDALAAVCLVAGGLFHLGIAVFHLFFWRLLRWREELPRLGFVNRQVMQVLNLCLTFLLLVAAWVSLAHTDELLLTTLGRTLTLALAVFWILRTAEQVMFFGGSRRSLAFAGLCLSGAALYLVPWLAACASGCTPG